LARVRPGGMAGAAGAPVVERDDAQPGGREVAALEPPALQVVADAVDQDQRFRPGAVDPVMNVKAVGLHDRHHSSPSAARAPPGSRGPPSQRYRWQHAGPRNGPYRGAVWRYQVILPPPAYGRGPGRRPAPPGTAGRRRHTAPRWRDPAAPAPPGGR